MKNDLSGNTVRTQAFGFQNSPNWTIFGIFNELLTTQNVNVARFARNEMLIATFSVIFKYSEYSPNYSKYAWTPCMATAGFLIML